MIDRSQYIGSSDAAMVADMSPWGSPLTVWNRLTGLTEPNGTPSLRMWIGEKMEPIILDLYEQRTGDRPARIIEGHPNETPPILSSEHPFIGAHPDYDHLEVKTASSARGWDEESMEPVTPTNMLIPIHYYLQVQHEQYVMDWSRMDIAVLLGHDEFRVYDVPRDDRVIKRLVDAEVELWEQAQAGELPAQSDPESRKAYLRARFPSEILPSRPATPEEEVVYRDWRNAVRLRAAAEAVEDEAAYRLQTIIGANDGLNGLVTWRKQTRNTVDPERLRERLTSIGRLDILRDSMRSTSFRKLNPIEKEAP